MLCSSERPNKKMTLQVITDTPRFAHLRKELVALVTCICGFVASIAFITDIGVASKYSLLPG